MKRLVCAVLCSSLMMSGCVTDPYTGEKKISKGAIGATTGAILGAAVSSKHDRGKGALIGAAVAGGAGVYMDNQEKKLRDRLQNTGVSVTRDGEQIYLNMPGSLTFQTNSSDIQGSFYSVLNSVSQVLKEFNNSNVDVTGHTDSVGDDNYNQQLSERRAWSVANYLTAQGLDASRLHVVGYGERYPVTSNDTEQGKQMNRRVEVQIKPRNQQ